MTDLSPAAHDLGITAADVANAVRILGSPTPEQVAAFDVVPAVPSPLNSHAWIWQRGIVCTACGYHLGTGGLKSLPCRTVR